jgi:hypothetical protein
MRVVMGEGNMAANKTMIIRHGEKPSKDGSLAGVSAAGAGDPEELVVRDGHGPVRWSASSSLLPGRSTTWLWRRPM